MTPPDMPTEHDGNEISDLKGKEEVSDLRTDISRPSRHRMECLKVVYVKSGTSVKAAAHYGLSPYCTDTSPQQHSNCSREQVHFDVLLS